MKSRPLKVGEYRKVKTWEQLLATEGAKVEYGDLAIDCCVFLLKMKTYCGEVFKIRSHFYDDWFKIDNSSYKFIDDFFTNDYYDENGNEIKMENEEFKVGDVFIRKDGLSFKITKIDNNLQFSLISKYSNGYTGAESIESVIRCLKNGTYRQIHKNEGEEHTWVDDINPLDQLELEANQTLAKIAKLREIEAKQAEIDTKIEEQNKRIEEYERD